MVKEKQLIKSYTYLIKKIIRENFLNFNMDIKDLESIGFLELVSCAKKFNKEKDGTFISFASESIYNSLKEYIDCSISLTITKSNISISIPNSLTEDKTKQLFAQIEYDNVRDEIINGNLWIVAHIIKCYFNYEKEKDDLISIGASALIDFVDNFIPKKNNSFYKGCSKYIYKSIKHYLVDAKSYLSLDEIIDNDQEETFNLIDYTLEDLKSTIESKDIFDRLMTYLTKDEKELLFLLEKHSIVDISKMKNNSVRAISYRLEQIKKKVKNASNIFQGAEYKSFEKRIKSMK